MKPCKRERAIESGNAADKKRRGLDLDPLSELRAELTAIAARTDPETIPF